MSEVQVLDASVACSQMDVGLTRDAQVGFVRRLPLTLDLQKA